MRRSWPPSKTQSIPGTSASRSATPRLVVSVDSRRPLLFAAIAPATALDRGPAVEEDRVAVLQEPDAGVRDRLFGGRVGSLAAGELALDGRLQRERAAVGPLQQPAGLEHAEVLADRGLRDAELLGELADPGAPANGHQLGDLRLPLVSEHGALAVAVDVHLTPPYQ